MLIISLFPSYSFTIEKNVNVLNLKVGHQKPFLKNQIFMVNPVISRKFAGCIDNSDRSMEANKITKDNNGIGNHGEFGKKTM